MIRHFWQRGKKTILNVSPKVFLRGISVSIVFLTLGGCLSPEKALHEADTVGCGIVDDFTRNLTGRTNDFSIVRPSDRLRNRLLVEQNLDPEFARSLRSSLSTNAMAPLPDPLVISLSDAMIIAPVNDDGYQSEKEKIFSQALSLDSSRQEFETTFAGVFGGDFSGSKSKGEPSSRNAGAKANPSVSKKLKNGMSLAGSLGLDVARLLTGDRTTSWGLTGDASLSVPLLRGAGREIAMEALTQAERDMMYAIYSFEDFRQQYVIKIAEGYYSMLRAEQNQMALRDNAARLDQNFRKASMQFDAGRLSQVELDQTRQDLLSNRDSINTSESSFKSQLDSYKKSLGLPIDSRVVLDMKELDLVRDRIMRSITETNSLGQPVQPLQPWTEEEAIAIAMTNRIEVVLARFKLEDARRQFKIASDNLLPELSLSFSANHGRNKKTGESWKNSTGDGAGLQFSPIWETTEPRNAYRLAAITMDQAERSWTTLLDTTRQLIRDDFRSINTAWSSFLIQREALEVARRRVRSTTIFQQAGKSSTRDVLEAQDALLKARNSAVGSVIDYRMACLKLRCDLSLLSITEEGLLREN